MSKNVNNVGLTFLAVGMIGGTCAVYLTLDVALRDVFEIVFCQSGFSIGEHIRASLWGLIIKVLAMGGAATIVAVLLGGLFCRRSMASVAGAIVGASYAVLASMVLATSFALREVCWKHGADIVVSRPSSQSAVLHINKGRSDPMTNHAGTSTNE